MNGLDSLAAMAVVFGLVILSSDIFHLYYTTFEYEKDHQSDYEENRYFKFDIDEEPY